MGIFVCIKLKKKIETKMIHKMMLLVVWIKKN